MLWLCHRKTAVSARVGHQKLAGKQVFNMIYCHRNCLRLTEQEEDRPVGLKTSSLSSGIGKFFLSTEISIWKRVGKEKSYLNLCIYKVALVVKKKLACQCRRHELGVWSLSRKDSVEQEMATHSSILAWEILWSMGVQRVGHDWSKLAHFKNGGFPGGIIGKESICQSRRLKRPGLIPGSGRSPGVPTRVLKRKS